MYNERTQPTETEMKINKGYQGETIEQKIRRIVNNKEPITDGAPLIYTERAKGIEPGYNIKTDRWDIAVEAMDKVTKTHQAKREERAKAQAAIIKDIEGGNNAGTADNSTTK